MRVSLEGRATALGGKGDGDWVVGGLFVFCRFFVNYCVLRLSRRKVRVG